MTVSTTNNRKDYTGNNTTDTYAFDFPIFDEGDIEVYVDEVLLTITTDYTVTLDGAAPNTGTITLVAGNLGTDISLAIVRNVAATQSVDLVNNDSFPAETIEAELDRLTMLAQQLQEKFDRALTLAPSSTESGLILGDFDGEAGNFLRVNAGESGVDFMDISATALDAAVAGALAAETASAASADSATASASAASASAATAAAFAFTETEDAPGSPVVLSAGVLTTVATVGTTNGVKYLVLVTAQVHDTSASSGYGYCEVKLGSAVVWGCRGVVPASDYMNYSAAFYIVGDGSDLTLVLANENAGSCDDSIGAVVNATRLQIITVGT